MAIRVPRFRPGGVRPAAAEPPAPARGGEARAFLYDAEATDRRVELDAVPVDELDDRQLLWIDVADLDEVDAVAARLKLGFDTVETMKHPRNRAELLFHTDYFHVNVVVAHGTTSGYEPVSLDCVAGANWILTVHDGPVDFLERFDERIRGDSQLGGLDAPGLVAAFLHEHVAGFVREIEPIEVELDHLDLEVMTGRVDDKAVFRRLVDLRRRLSHLRRLFALHGEIYGLLARPDFEMLSNSDSPEGFASVAKRSEQALQSLETTREMIVSSFEIYTTWTAHGTNQVMKLLTVVSVTLLPPTLLASIMGMNSIPSAFGTPAAFLVTLTAMLALAAAVLTTARRKRWI